MMGIGEVGLERVGDDHAAGAQHALDSQREPRARFRVPAPGGDLFLLLCRQNHYPTPSPREP
jgi:hypothetical protein